MRRYLLLAAATALVAACGSPEADADGDGKITMKEAAEKSKDLVKPEPGQYRATVEMVNVEVPGAPKEIQEMMKKMISVGPQTHEYCLTKEEAAKGFEEMARQSNKNEDCSFEKFETDGGTIDAVMNCSRPEHGMARMTMQGTGTTTSSSMTMTMDAQTPDGKTMKMTMKSNQERIGDCDG
ncbi:DUF3617 domain-containing protein [Qipengyuania soli]|uniref:DUF3617 domain-containing protein n=1 Tax=Qipengyuania soli TaxID=2782568 RepID=A0A7S8F2M0_9SPHN|nr:DUF3617 domain-containing protein [Qipengyuania soli]QPC98007.1 DUF3617 domain-containing protein [Qipengyuania soli]